MCCTGPRLAARESSSRVFELSRLHTTSDVSPVDVPGNRAPLVSHGGFSLRATRILDTAA